jgi:hypothetical protein
MVVGLDTRVVVTWRDRSPWLILLVLVVLASGVTGDPTVAGTGVSGCGTGSGSLGLGRGVFAMVFPNTPAPVIRLLGMRALVDRSNWILEHSFRIIVVGS